MHAIKLNKNQRLIEFFSHFKKNCQLFRQTVSDRRIHGRRLTVACMAMLLMQCLPAQTLPAKSNAAITEVAIESTASVNQTLVPVSFGQAFADGDLAAGTTLTAHTREGTTLPLQVDIKATHPDGSVRHAIVSTILPTLPSGKTETILLTQSPSKAPAAEHAISAERLLASGFEAEVRILLDGKIYTADARPSLASGNATTWLTGPIVSEWLMTVPLRNAQGVAHPHLHVRYAIRDYASGHATRIDVSVENDWAYQPAPQNFTYDVLIDIAGKNVYAQNALTHYHHARWRKTFWWQQQPQINIRENSAYLIASKAVPNYDQSVKISEQTLRGIAADWHGSKTEPMGPGIAANEMPTTGGRPDIGLIPGWGVSYLLSMDRRARDVTLGTADLAGSWSIHYRDAKTDRPVSLENYPYMTLLGTPSDTINPQTKKSEIFPPCHPCNNPNIADAAHAPAFNYLPYLLTGDYYQLEELQFWAMWNSFRSNPGYRGNVLGLVHRAQVRDQAWSLRNIADAAYLTPDHDKLKAPLLHLVENNLRWYNTAYSNNPAANTLGINVDNAIEYNNGLGIAPWMDDFFTAVVGHMVEQGFSNAQPLLRYKAKFPVSRMTQPNFCWIFGAIYSINVRPTPNAPLFSHIEQTYVPSLQANYPAQASRLAELSCGSQAMADELKLHVGEMTGYSPVVTGFPANMQPALAYSVDSGVAGASKAWAIFKQRAQQPDYGNGPQFAIVPR